MTEELKNKNHPAVNYQTQLPSIKNDPANLDVIGSGSTSTTATKIGN